MTFELFTRKKHESRKGVKKMGERILVAHNSERGQTEKKNGKLGINENDKHEKVYIHDNLTLISLLLRAKRTFYC